MLRESHTAPHIRRAVAVATGMAMTVWLFDASTLRGEALGLGLKKSRSGGEQQPAAPAFDPTASPLEPEEVKNSETSDNSPNPEISPKVESQPANEVESTVAPEFRPDATPEATPEARTETRPEITPEKPSEPVRQPVREAETIAAPQTKPIREAAPRRSNPVKIKNDAAASGKNASNQPEAFLELAPALNLDAQKESAFITRPENPAGDTAANAANAQDAADTASDNTTESTPTKTDPWIDFKDPAREAALKQAAGVGGETATSAVNSLGGKRERGPKAANAAAGQAVSTLPRGGVVVKFDPTKVINRQDISQRFSYVLPDGWRTYQIPYQKHDVLTLRDKNKMLATISFTDETRRGNLTKLKDLAAESAKENITKYELISSEIITLKSGLHCARILGQGQIDDIQARQLQYVVPLAKRLTLVVTLTVGKIMGDKYDKLMHDVVESLSTDAFITRTKQVE